MIPSSRIYALIIGINDYRDSKSRGFSKLACAAPDADSFRTYLAQDLQVPEDNISFLVDDQATRTNIIDGFTALIHDPRIVKNQSAIIIFYAGHGTYSPKPAEWENWETSGGQLEMLCPVDIGEDDATGQEIQGIPDRTISVLLDQMSGAKGNNITLILDCCHSAGMSRNVEEPQYYGMVPRMILDPPHISGSCDVDIWSSHPRSIAIAQGFSGTARDSHVLLAACSARQRAWEDQRHHSGLFTRFLLKALRRYGAKDLTYSSLMHRILAPQYQTPHCEGKHVRRRLFDASSDEADTTLILCRLENGNTPFELDAGTLHGVVLGSEYDIFETDVPDASAVPQVQAVITSVGPFTSSLQPSTSAVLSSQLNKNRTVWYARLTKAADLILDIFCADAAYLASLLSVPESESEGLVVTVRPIDDADKADLILTVVDDQVHFDRGAKSNITGVKDVDVPTRLSGGSIAKGAFGACRHVLNAFARFVMHLTRTLAPPGAGGSDVVTISLKEVRKQGGKVKMVGEELFVSESEHITLAIDKRIPCKLLPRYGILLENTADIPLYVHIFAFDINTLDIMDWQLPMIPAGTGALDTDNVDTELAPGGSLSVGFGNGGSSPWQFRLSRDQFVDVSFFKVFISTRPTDMRNIIQSSPFEAKRTTYDPPVIPSLPVTDFWATKIITIVQKARTD